MKERAVGFGLETQFLTDEKIEAGIACIGAGNSDDVGDVFSREFGFSKGFLAGLYGEIDPGASKKAVELADGWGDASGPEGIFDGFDDRA